MHAKQIELAGLTSVSFNRQTLTPHGETTGTNSNTTQVAVETAYYVNQAIGVGVAASYNKFSFGEGADKVDLSFSAAAPFVRYRVKMSEKGSLDLTGTAGITRNSISGTASGFDSPDTTGKVFGGGARISYFVSNAASVNVGLRYEKSTFTQSGQDMDASGFLVGMGLSVYFK
jgi:hypothetical protein